MALLAIDTAAEYCSLALWHQGECHVRHQLALRQQAQVILPWLDELLADLGLSRSAIEAIGCGVGPGAFTGVRVATSVAQGLAYALQCPVVPLSSLALLAQGVWRQHAATQILVAQDARMGEVYWGQYQVCEGRVEAQVADALLAPEKVQVAAGDYWCVGQGWSVYASSLEAALGSQVGRTLVEAEAADAQDAFPLMQAVLDQGGGCAAAELQPVYLRNNVAAKPKR